MQRIVAGCIVLIVSLGVCLSGCEPAAGGQAFARAFSAGAAEAVITPTKDPDAIHDDLYVRAMVIGDGDDRLAIITADLIIVGPGQVMEIRKGVREATGIPEANVVINASHTHNTRPRSGGDDLWDGLPWGAWMVTQFVKVVIDADEARKPATLRASRVPVQVGFNRRLEARNGEIWMLPNPAGPQAAWSDTLGAYASDDNKRIAFLFTYAAHPVVVHESSDLISADVPGTTVRTLKEIITAHGQLPLDGVFMFGQGCGGNVNMYPLRGGHDACDAVGRDFASAIAIRNDPVDVPPGKLKARDLTLSLPLRPPPSVEEVKRLMTANEDDKRLEKLLRKAEEGDIPRLVDYPMRAVAIGDDLCILSLPYETFCEYQLYAVAVSPFEHTIVLGYSTGGFVYVATAADYDRNARVDYEAGLTGNSLDNWYAFPLDASAEGIIKVGIKRLLDELKAQ